MNARCELSQERTYDCHTGVTTMVGQQGSWNTIDSEGLLLSQGEREFLVVDRYGKTSFNTIHYNPRIGLCLIHNTEGKLYRAGDLRPHNIRNEGKLFAIGESCY